MTENMRIISSNLADGAALTSADFVGTLPVSNLQVEGRARVARTANAAGLKVINGDFETARAVSGCVLYGHNLTSSATWRLQCWAGPAQTGAVVYDSSTVRALRRIGWGNFRFGLVPWGATVYSGWPRAHSVLWLPEAVGARSFRLSLADPANAAGYIQAKRLLLGSYFSPGLNPEYGLDLNWRSLTTQQRTQAASLRSDGGPKFRALSGELGHLDASERARWMEISREVGLEREVFVSVFPDAGSSLERDYSMLGKFTVMPKGSHGDWASWSSDFVIEET